MTDWLVALLIVGLVGFAGGIGGGVGLGLMLIRQIDKRIEALDELGAAGEDPGHGT